MEETKELQTAYKIFRAVIYVSLLLEFFEYAIDPELLDYWGGIVCDVHDRIKRWFIYLDGNLIWSKIATFVIILAVRLSNGYAVLHDTAEYLALHGSNHPWNHSDSCCS